MIFTITLNPAIDRTVLVQSVHKTDVTRVQQTFRQAAGKGINVSRVLHQLGYETIACALLGGQNGAFVSDQLKESGVPLLSVEVDGETRENIKIVPEEGNIIELNESGPTVKVSDPMALLDMVLDQAHPGDAIVFTGSLPPGLPDDIYQTMIRAANDAGLVTVLDASGNRFVHAVYATPTIIKPNRFELEEYAKRTLDDREMSVIASELLSLGVQEIVLTLGASGARYVDAKNSYRVAPIVVDAINPIGAGESFLAGYLAARVDGLAPRERLAFATAVATSSVLYEGTGPKDMTHIQHLLAQVRVSAE
jgi:1-phosphofructokinase